MKRELRKGCDTGGEALILSVHLLAVICGLTYIKLPLTIKPQTKFLNEKKKIWKYNSQVGEVFWVTKALPQITFHRSWLLMVHLYITSPEGHALLENTLRFYTLRWLLQSFWVIEHKVVILVLIIFHDVSELAQCRIQFFQVGSLWNIWENIHSKSITLLHGFCNSSIFILSICNQICSFLIWKIGRCR